ncbi:MAG: hypothetical protein F4Y45_02325 [Acidobacteria bacterium]|nr:hypothetical protein [Acidobacteriota bacterium]MYJ03930.1 hypothetical protein [Acidobacteriota bacterium]
MSEVQDDPFDRELAAFERMRAELERAHLGRWVVIAGEKLWGEQSFESFQDASNAARPVFGDTEVLIREVGPRRVIDAPASLVIEGSVAP